MRGLRVTNHMHYFGTPEATACVEVVWQSWPTRIAVYRTSPISAQTAGRRIVASFRSAEEYRAWLVAEYDDGTVAFEG